MEFEAARKRVDALSERIRELQDAYYRRDEVLVSDADYDALVRELEALEQEHPILSSDDSPTQAVGFGSGALFSPVTHAERMFSLDNVFSTEEMTAWLEKIQSVHPGATYLCELKVDGLALNLRYQAGRLVSAATRGDGVTETRLDLGPLIPRPRPALEKPWQGEPATTCTCRSLPGHARISLSTTKQPQDPRRREW